MSFTVFGSRPDNTICLPDVAYAVRFNCKDGGGGIFVGGSDPKHRRSGPDDKIDINIIKVAKFFGSLGKTRNVLWTQLFFIPAPGVDSKILPPNTVCVGYLKKQSIGALFNCAQEAMQYGEPAEGIFSLGFVKESGKDGPYYSVGFEWRQRQNEAEQHQLELIKGFMAQSGQELIDAEGTREMIYLTGKPAEEIYALMAAAMDSGEEEQPKLAGRTRRALPGQK